jgi:death-on-curing protein
LNNPVWITLTDFEALSFNLARELYTFNQPIPDFSTRNPGILESCLETPLQKFNKKDLYPTFAKKLAALFYFLIKNHPFQNGNKRIAVTALLVVLYSNGRWIKVDPLKIYKFAKSVASSDRKNKNEVLIRIEKFIADHMINF